MTLTLKEDFYNLIIDKRLDSTLYRVSADTNYMIRWTNNKVLLFSMELYQYPMTNHNRKQYEKNYIYM